MTLLIDELYDGVTFEQNFRVQKTQQVAHLRPHIYKQGTLVDGDLTIQVLQNTELLKQVSISYEDINANIPATYAHGFIRFDMQPLQLNHNRTQEYTNYTLKLFMSNYTTDANNFIGAVRGYERKFYNTYGAGVVDNEAINDFLEPLEFEIFELRY